jgi:twitching motility protein PilT
MALFRSSSKKAGKSELLRKVQARDWSDRDEMSEILRELGQQKDLKVEELMPLLTSSEPAIRFFAEVQFGDRLDARGVDALIKALGSKTSRTQAMILHTMLRANAELCKTAIECLVMSGERALSRTAMEALSTLPSHQVGNEFHRFLQHDKAEIRRMALVKIQDSPALLGEKAIQNTIIGMAGDDDEQIRMRVLDSLPELDAGEAVRVCLARLKDPSPSVQQKAVRVLTRAMERVGKSEEAEEQLLGLLTDGSEAVRNGVLDIIMKRPDRGRLLRHLLLFCKGLMGWMRDRTLQSLRRYTDDLIPEVVKLMNDRDDDVRSMALTLGSTLESPEVVPHVIGLLNDDDWWLRMIAAETLGKVGDRRAVRPLLKLLDDDDAAMVAMEALANIGDRDATAPICRTLSRNQAEIRIEAIAALRKLGDRRCIPVLEEAMIHDPSASVRRRAGELLDEFSGARDGASGRMKAIDADNLRRVRGDDLNPMEKLLVEARKAGASDLHIIVDSKATMRVHGKLQEMDTPMFTPALAEEYLRSVLPTRVHRVFAEKNQADFCHTIEKVGRYRCNVYVERKGLAGAFRTIPNEVPALDEIGLPSHLADLVNYHQGLIVVAGPSGSGKSTTLAALVNLFNEQKRDHILLLEDPIEFVHHAKGCLVNQREVGRHTRSFAAALRGALREDPDVIVVGQMRDPETVRLAIEASETGHLVIATMNTTSAPKTVDRIIDAFPIAEQTQIRIMLSETLKAVICQQLLPRADGAGRAALFEVMMGTLGVRMMIRDNKTYQIPGQMQIGEAKGHITIDGALARLLENGLISAEEAWRRAQSKDQFEARLRGEALAGIQQAGAR